MVIKFVSSITGGSLDHVLWTFGDGTTSTSTDSIVYHDYYVGDYTTSLDGWLNDGRYKKVEKIINVRIYRADFVGDHIFQNSPPYDPVDFTDLSDGGPTTWLWDFGDGTTSTSQNPSHDYLEEGFYTISLTCTYASDQTYTKTKPDYVTLYNYPP